MKQKIAFLVLLMLLLVAAAAATPMCPGGLTPLPSATFGGSGIPNDAVCQQSAGGVTAGLMASGRYTNPAVTNDGLGTYFAQSGGDILTPPSAACPLGICAKWNFGFIVQNSSNNSVLATLTWGDGGFFTQMISAGGTWQDSWNKGFGFIDTGVAVPGVYSPSSLLFDPSATGVYPFTLTVNSVTGGPITAVAMDVQVGDTSVPEPSSLALLSFGLVTALGLGPRRWTHRRRHGRI